MKISILEQAVLSENMHGETAIQNAIKIAKTADQLGFHRIWHSEHHNMQILQGSSPEVLLAALGASTQNIRIGSGGVMISNHSPYHIAENFRTLEALYPGRVDCGIGRASGGDPFSTSLLSTLPAEANDFTSQIDALDTFLHDQCKRATAMPMIQNAPPIWLLSAASNPKSGMFAAQKGLGLVIGLFINPLGDPKAASEYRRNFQSSADFKQARVILAVNCVCSNDPEKLAVLKKGSDFFRLMRDSGRYPNYFPSPKSLENFEIGEKEQSYLEKISNREVIGNAEQVKQQLLQRAELYGADEVMVTMMTYSLDDKLEALQSLSAAFKLI